MPTLTAIALDRLLEPSLQNPSIRKPLPVKSKPVASPGLYATPALYSIPSATPIPDSPSSFPPSPYIVNHKRRGPRLQTPLPPPFKAENAAVSHSVGAKNVDADEILGTTSVFVSVEENNSGNVIAGKEEAVVCFDFLDSVSSANALEGADCFGAELQPNLESETGEYYDACDEISSSDGGSGSSFRKIEDEMQEMRLSLLLEIERRKEAQDAVDNLQIKWRNLRQHLFAVGLALPDITTTPHMEEATAIAADLSQQIVVARAVSASIARGCATAVTEMEFEPQIEAKNFEIARLLDRLHYYEATNREMSQRNQKAVEKARQRRHRRSRRQKWFWCSIGIVVAVGSAAIAWSYLPSSDVPVSHDDK